MGETIISLFGAVIAAIILILIFVIPIVLVVFIIWWIIKCMVFFVKVPNQLDEIIESLERMQKQLDALASTATQEAPKAQETQPTQNKPQTQDTHPTQQAKNPPKTHDELNLQSLLDSYIPDDH
ncbi:MAG: hypothetical protein IIW17_08155 [Clostridia bacterium]|nr:hypothetical protein [Clostridia bacterium]